MKTPLSLILTFCFCLVAILLLAGCGGEKGPAINVQKFTQDLKSEDKGTLETACVELAKAGPAASPAVSALIPLLKHKEAGIRRLAAYALMEIGPEAKAALPALKELMADTEQTVVTQAANSVRAIDPSSAKQP